MTCLRWLQDACTRLQNAVRCQVAGGTGTQCWQGQSTAVVSDAVGHRSRVARSASSYNSRGVWRNPAGDVPALGGPNTVCTLGCCILGSRNTPCSRAACASCSPPPDSHSSGSAATAHRHQQQAPCCTCRDKARKAKGLWCMLVKPSTCPGGGQRQHSSTSCRSSHASQHHGTPLIL